MSELLHNLNDVIRQSDKVIVHKNKWHALPGMFLCVINFNAQQTILVRGWVLIYYIVDQNVAASNFLIFSHFTQIKVQRAAKKSRSKYVFRPLVLLQRG